MRALAVGLSTLLLSACAGATKPAEPPNATPAKPASTVDVAAPEETPAEPDPTQAPSSNREQKMDIVRLEGILREIDANLEGGGGRWRFEHEGVEVYCMADPAADRMRFFVGVTNEADMTEEQRARVLEANFHSALDARYAVTSGTLFSAFLHPLSPLTTAEAIAGIEQVVTLAKTYGTSYTSGELIFAPSN